MTKPEWRKHIEEATGATSPYKGGAVQAWRDAIAKHTLEQPDCPACKDRQRTRKATIRRSARHEAYLAAGLVKVRGALGGTYYE